MWRSDWPSEVSGTTHGDAERPGRRDDTKEHGWRAGVSPGLLAAAPASRRRPDLLTRMESRGAWARPANREIPGPCASRRKALQADARPMGGESTSRCWDPGNLSISRGRRAKKASDQSLASETGESLTGGGGAP